MGEVNCCTYRKVYYIEVHQIVTGHDSFTNEIVGEQSTEVERVPQKHYAIVLQLFVRVMTFVLPFELLPQPTCKNLKQLATRSLEYICSEGHDPDTGLYTPIAWQ